MHRPFSRTHLYLKGVQSTRDARIIWWMFRSGKSSMRVRTGNRNAGATSIIVVVGWLRSP